MHRSSKAKVARSNRAPGTKIDGGRSSIGRASGRGPEGCRIVTGRSPQEFINEDVESQVGIE